MWTSIDDVSAPVLFPGTFTPDGVTLRTTRQASSTRAFMAANRLAVQAQLTGPDVVATLLQISARQLEADLACARRAPQGTIMGNALAVVEENAYRTELMLRVYQLPDPTARTVALRLIESGFDGLPTALEAAVARSLDPADT